MIDLIRKARAGNAAQAAAPCVRVCSVSDVPEESTFRVEVGNGPGLCLANSGGTIYALVDECTHGQVRLSEGEVDEGEIECYLHGGRFDLATGRPTCLPPMDVVRTYRVTVEGDGVMVEIDEA